MQRPILLVSALACMQSGATAQSIDFESISTLDRWMYPFNGAPGTRFSATTFGAPRLAGFDDHDAQFIVGFDTSVGVPTGLAASEYRVTSLVVTATISNNNQFRFDPTSDPQASYESQEGGYPNLIADLDEGRPIEIWGLGYRDGFDASSWTEITTFGLSPVIPPAQEARTAFMAIFDAAGNPTEATNNLTQEIDRTPMGVGQIDTIAPGGLVPADSVVTFEVDLCDPGTRAYLAQSLALGELRFAISSLHFADGGPGGGTSDPLYPEFYTRENPIAQILGLEPTVELTVFTGPIGDYNSDGLRNFFDIADYINDFNAREPLADINGDCLFNFFDISAFIAEYNTP
ncbi:MAG: GC-type dockerin domain-anchored protein [Phycisphaerales bacterium]